MPIKIKGRGYWKVMLKDLKVKNCTDLRFRGASIDDEYFTSIAKNSSTFYSGVSISIAFLRTDLTLSSYHVLFDFLICLASNIIIRASSDLFTPGS